MGQVPLYCKLKDSQEALLRGVESIVLYISVAFKNGGSLPWLARDTAHRPRRKLISPEDI
jgi:hypothetical protein